MNKIAMAITTGAVITAVITLAALAYKNPDAVNTVKTKGKKILTRFKATPHKVHKLEIKHD